LVESLTTILGSQSHENNTEKAIKLLTKEYADRLGLDSLLEASILLEDVSKASAFLSLNGKLRDMWLEKSAGIELDNLGCDIE